MTKTVDVLKYIEPLTRLHPDVTIAVLDFEGTLLYITDAVRSVFRWRPEQVIGRSVKSLVHEEDRGVWGQNYGQSLDERGGCLRYRLLFGDGTHEWVETRSKRYEGYLVCITRPVLEAALADDGWFT